MEQETRVWKEYADFMIGLGNNNPNTSEGSSNRTLTGLGIWQAWVDINSYKEFTKVETVMFLTGFGIGSAWWKSVTKESSGHCKGK